MGEIAELSTTKLSIPFTQKSLAAALRPAIASKQYGYEDLLADLVAEAAIAVMPQNPKNFNVDNVRVVKVMGGSLSSSKVVQGMVFGKESEGLGHPVFLWSRAEFQIHVVRNGQKAYKSQSLCLHVSARYRPDGDQRNCSVKKC